MVVDRMLMIAQASPLRTRPILSVSPFCWDSGSFWQESRWAYFPLLLVGLVSLSFYLTAISHDHLVLLFYASSVVGGRLYTGMHSVGECLVLFSSGKMLSLEDQSTSWLAHLSASHAGSSTSSAASQSKLGSVPGTFQVSNLSSSTATRTLSMPHLQSPSSWWPCVWSWFTTIRKRLMTVLALRIP